MFRNHCKIEHQHQLFLSFAFVSAMPGKNDWFIGKIKLAISYVVSLSWLMIVEGKRIEIGKECFVWYSWHSILKQNIFI